MSAEITWTRKMCRGLLMDVKNEHISFKMKCETFNASFSESEEKPPCYDWECSTVENTFPRFLAENLIKKACLCLSSSQQWNLDLTHLGISPFQNKAIWLRTEGQEREETEFTNMNSAMWGIWPILNKLYQEKKKLRPLAMVLTSSLWPMFCNKSS